jgi:hypothetical protein
LTWIPWICTGGLTENLHQNLCFAQVGGHPWSRLGSSDSQRKRLTISDDQNKRMATRTSNQGKGGRTDCLRDERARHGNQPPATNIRWTFVRILPVTMGTKDPFSARRSAPGEWYQCHTRRGWIHHIWRGHI